MFRKAPATAELRCPKCMSLDIAPCVPRGMRDEMMINSGKTPKQCRYCGKKFYVRVAEGQTK